MNMKTILISLTVLVITGCGINPYKDESPCLGYIENGQCYDMIETYERTHDFDRDEYRAILAQQRIEDSESERSDEGEEVHVVMRPAPAYPIAQSSTQPRPVLQQAVPFRVWIAPFADAQGRLHVPGYVYGIMQEPKWIYDSESTRQSTIALPLIHSTSQ